MQVLLSITKRSIPAVLHKPCHHTLQVTAVAINSGLVAFPTSFDLICVSVSGLALWRPVPPPGYVSMGLVAAPGLTPEMLSQPEAAKVGGSAGDRAL